MFLIMIILMGILIIKHSKELKSEEREYDDVLKEEHLGKTLELVN